MRLHKVFTLLALLFARDASAADNTAAPEPPQAAGSTLLPASPGASQAPAPPAAPALDFSSYKTADEFWKQMEKLQAPPQVQPKSREEFMAQIGAWFATQQAAANAFVKTFPDDPRHWEAKMMALRAGLQLPRFSGNAALPELNQQIIDEILSAPDAPATTKGEAAFISAAMRTPALNTSKPDTYAAFQKAASDFLAKFPEHPLAPQMEAMQMRVLGTDPRPEGEEILKKLAAGTNPQTAKAATDMIAHRQQAAELKSKPVDLKLTASDGKAIDVATLRGKVVLLDFWASWCGPCMAEMPNVVSTYQKFHDQGFEIIGISLDQDKAAMEAALKKQGMTWPQQFDGAGWQNKIAVSFGVNAIPAAWLLDKKGMVRQTDLRGEALAAGVEKLLAE